MIEAKRPRPPHQNHRVDVLLGAAIHQHMGLREADNRDPSAGLVLDITENLVNNSKMLHGGLVATSLDVACAYIIFPTLADNEVVLTNSLSISYLRPAPLDYRLWVKAEVLRRGAATAFLRAEAGIEDKVVATAQVVKSVVTLED